MGPIPWGAICRGTPHGFAAHTIRLLEIDNTLRTFTRCGEANLYGMVDAQIATIEGELLA